MNTPVEIDLPTELRAIAARPDTPEAVADTLTVIADAVEIELAHGKKLHDVVTRIVHWAPWPDEDGSFFWTALRESRGLVR